MMSKEENDLLTQTGSGSPAGSLLRRYWQPVALVDELPARGATLAVRILGEDLVLFRDDKGERGFWEFIAPIEELISATGELRMVDSGAFIMVGCMILRGAVWSSRASRAAASIETPSAIQLIPVKKPAG
jgi:hypothetical protein